MNIQIQTSTPKLAASLQFYRDLGMTVEEHDNCAFAYEAGITIKINYDRYARPGILIYEMDLLALKEKLSSDQVIIEYDNYIQLKGACGVNIYLLEGSPPVTPNGSSKSILGNYQGISLETICMDKSLALWSVLGFELEAGEPSQSWMTLKNKAGVAISLMALNSCPHVFYNPSLTYFNSGKNDLIIAEIRKKNISIHEEVTHFNPNGEVDNVILRDPGGVGFFVFND